VEEQARRSAGSDEFQTEGAATLKPREANAVWTRGTDNKLVLEERRELKSVKCNQCNKKLRYRRETARQLRTYT